MRALGLGGGGSKGSFACGAVREVRQAGITWDLVVGCSTGALMASLIALDQIADLVTLYSTVTNADIYTARPAVELVGHRSLYDSAPLWQCINAIVTPTVYQQIQAAPVVV